jgi:hypothetical protein
VILLATIAFLLWKLRQRNRQEKGAADAQREGGGNWLAYEPQNGGGGGGGGAGLGVVVAEMPGKEGWYHGNPGYGYASSELPGAGNEAVRLELPASPRGRAY